MASVKRSGAGGGTEARYPQTGGYATNESARPAGTADTHRKRSHDGYPPDRVRGQPILRFAVLSLLAHVIMLYGVRLELPRSVSDPTPLAVTLQPLAPPAPVVVPPRVAPPFAPRLAPTPPATSPNSAAVPHMAVASEYEPESAVNGNAAVESLPVAAAEIPPVAVAAPEPPAPAPPVVAAESLPSPEPVVLAGRLPRKGTITYTLYLGRGKFDVGRTLQTWEVSEDNYRLSSVSETTGLVALFARHRHAYESHGKLTAGGLRPVRFTSDRVRTGRRENAVAEFDWSTMTAKIDNPQRGVELPPGAQDLMSFMYQLGLVPLAPGRIELAITNGWKLERYVLVIGAEEPLETPFGTVTAVPVKQVPRQPREESVELWLAREYRWLPVRIRFFDREGQPAGEQLVSEIRLSDD